MTQFIWKWCLYFRKKAHSPTGGNQSTTQVNSTSQQSTQRQNLQTNLSTSPPQHQVSFLSECLMASEHGWLGKRKFVQMVLVSILLKHF